MFPPLRLRSALNLGGLSPRELAVRTWQKIDEHEVMTRAAAVAFYAMLATVPFLALLLTLAAQQLPDLTGGGKPLGLGGTPVGELDAGLDAVVPREAHALVRDQVARLQREPPVGLLSLGVAIALWLASSLFLAVIDALNRIYGVADTRSLVKLRLIAMGMALLQAVILLGSLVAIAAWPQILKWAGLDPNGAVAWLATAAKWAVVFVTVLLSFALSCYVGPDAEQRWEWLTVGSVIGTIAFLAASLLFRLYVQGFANYDKAYGSLAGVMVLMFWYWVVGLVLLGAAEVNKVIEDASPLGKDYGQKVDPAISPDLRALPAEPHRGPIGRQEG
jgi:membrane protein